MGGWSTTLGTANTWTTANTVGVTSGYNIYATLNNYIEFTGLQLEKGTIPTPFEFRPYCFELQLCQRYYLRKNIDGAGAWGGSAGTIALIAYSYPVQFRITPYTINWISGGIAGNGLADYVVTGQAGPVRNSTISGCTMLFGITGNTGANGQGAYFQSALMEFIAEF